MDIVTVDFETAYDRDYSLTKLTTEAYIRDPRFEVIGVGVKVNNGPVDWYSGDNPGRFLKQYDFSDKAILAHNTVFDGAILSWHFGIRPKLWLDTLSMARALHSVEVGMSLKALVAYYRLGEKGDEVVRAMGKRRLDFNPDELAAYAAYCRNDVDLTYRLFRKMAPKVSATEINLIDKTLRMFTEPTIVLDTNLLLDHLHTVQTKKASLIDDLGLDGWTEEEAKSMLMSNEKLALHLASMGVHPPTKVSIRTGKTAFAFSKTDTSFTKLLDHDDPRVVAVVAARLGVKSTIEESRTKSLLAVADRGPLPVMLAYYAAHTGRFGGADKMNLQNLPRGGTLRKSLCAPKGMVMVACDSSQIEARMVAWLAGQINLLDAFREGRDVYSEFATSVYGRKITKDDKLERHVGKTAILGLGYGMGWEKFRATLAIGFIRVNLDPAEALRVVNLYRTENQHIARFWRRCGDALWHMVCEREGHLHPVLPYGRDWIGLPNGMTIKYPLLREFKGNGYQYIGDARTYREAVKQRVLTGEVPDSLPWVKIYGGKVTENVTQALARIVVAEQALRIAERYRLILQVHDENVIMVPEREADEAAAFMKEVMSTPPAWAPDLPVACEVGFGPNYGEAK